MVTKDIAILADSLEETNREQLPRSIDAMKTAFVPQAGSIHPCCPQTKTTLVAVRCRRQGPEPSGAANKTLSGEFR